MAAALGLAFVLASVLAGCSESLIDRLPGELGGLPAGTPARPITPYQYPAVHDMPPPRATTPLSEDEQVRLEKELTAVRDRQEAREGRTPKKKDEPAAKKSKTKPGEAKNGQAAGAKTNP